MEKIQKFGEFDGIEMGVKADGTPFLSGRGLAALCGVSVSVINDLGKHLSTIRNKPRGRKIANILDEYKDFDSDELYESLEHNNQMINAYPEPVCMAILEYYAHEAGERVTDKAKRISRLLMRKTFKDFVYSLVGYRTPQKTFSQYMLSRIDRHHDVSNNPLPDGYFCLFDKMIEILHRFDLRIGYQLRETWFDYSKGDRRFLEPDISMGRRFSQLFTSDFEDLNKKFISEYNKRLQINSKKKFWTEKLKKLKWNVDRAKVERNLRVKYIKPEDIGGRDPSLPIPEKYIDRREYSFKPSPDSNRPDDLPPAYCYSNNYTSLFYEWLREVFFKYIWREYIMERDPEGWMSRYNYFLTLEVEKKQSILRTAEGGMVTGFEFYDIWERQLPSVG